MYVLIGLGAGVIAAVLCAAFYRRGVKDGMQFTPHKARRLFGGPVLKNTTAAAAQEDEAEVQNELMRKYELIMGYDPYGERV